LKRNHKRLRFFIMEIFITLSDRYRSMPKIDKMTKKPIKVTERELKEYHLYLLSKGLKSVNRFWGRELIVTND
jgi:hypothetical protein